MNELLKCPSCEDGEKLELDAQFGHYFTKCTFCKGTGKLTKIQSKNLIKMRKIYREMRENKHET